MKNPCTLPLALALLAVPGLLPPAGAQTPAAPYRVLSSAKVGGDGGFDYVYADSAGRRLYVPRGNRVTVFELDTLKPAGEIPGTHSVHGVAVDPVSRHGFSSSQPVVMWDTDTLATIKTVAVQGGPDGILFDPKTERVFVLSHSEPNVTALDARDGSIVGTIDLGGAPEEGASDAQGRVFFDIEDKDSIAVVDPVALKVTARFGLGGKGGGPSGLAIDARNHILFAFCRSPQAAVILDAVDGRIITSLPIGMGVDAAEFNPGSMEAFSSQRDGTLTVIKENSPTDFEVEQNVRTQAGAKTSSLDPATNRIYLITAEFSPPTPEPAAASTNGQGPGAAHPEWRRRGPMVPNSFTILVVGR
jgi:DNA-binding beta-propeller fold protein YncE